MWSICPKLSFKNYCWENWMNERLNYVTQTQKQKTWVATRILTKHMCDYKVHKLNQMYILKTKQNIFHRVHRKCATVNILRKKSQRLDCKRRIFATGFSKACVDTGNEKLSNDCHSSMSRWRDGIRANQELLISEWCVPSTWQKTTDKGQ